MKKSTLLIESEATNILLAAGMPANLQGFHFLKDAVMDVIKYPTHLHQLTKELYPFVAKMYGVTATIVERSMRHAIVAAKKNGLSYNINKMLNTTYLSTDDRPCNGCFIGLIAEIVKKNMYKYIATIEEDESTENQKLVRDLQEDMGELSSTVSA